MIEKSLLLSLSWSAACGPLDPQRDERTHIAFAWIED